jgi:hypothetical protein
LKLQISKRTLQEWEQGQAAFAELGAGSLVVGIVLVVLIPFLRKLITDKAETPPIEAATVVPVA